MARKSETKLRRTEKKKEKENSTNETDFSENEIPDLNSLKPFEINQKQTDIDNSSSDKKEECIEGKVKWIVSSRWCECCKQCKIGKKYNESLCC